MPKTVAVTDSEAPALALDPTDVTESRPTTLDELRALGGRVVGNIVDPLEEWDMTK